MERTVIEGYRLSPQQARIWARGQAAGRFGRAQCLISIAGELRQPILTAALEGIVEAHEILRTRFETVASVAAPLQVIDDGHPFVAVRHDWTGMSRHRQDAAAAELWTEMSCAPSDLRRGPALAATLVRLSDSNHLLLLSLPELIADGATLDNIVRELADRYAALAQGKTPARVDVPQYADLAEWQHQLFVSPEAETGRSFWRAQAAPLLLARHLLLGDSIAPPNEAPAQPVVVARASGVASQLHAIAARRGIGPAAAVLACWCALLWRLAGLSEFTIGLASDLRKHEDLRGALGPLSTVVPLVANVHDRLPLIALAEDIDGRMRQMRAWDVVYGADASAGDGAAGFPICFEARDAVAPHAGAGVTFAIVRRGAFAMPFELKLCCTTWKDGSFEVAFEHDPNAVGSGTVDRLARMLDAVLGCVAGSEGMPVGWLDLLGDAERRRVVIDFNRSACGYPRTKCLHHLIEEQTRRSPDAIAVRSEAGCLSYRELNARANQLAHHLRRRDVGPDVRVAVCLERGLEMAVALLAILKAGGAYVPLDPTCPRERLRFMLADSAPTVLVTGASLASLFAGSDVPVVDVVSGANAWADQPDTNPVIPELTPEHLCYIIYTSGSTGRPKGVMNPHRCVVNRLVWGQRAWGLAAEDAMLCKTSLSFDGSLREIFWPWTVGACVVMARPDGHKDPDYLLDTIEREQIRTLNLVPSLLQVLLEHPNVVKLAALRQVLCGGEALPVALSQRLRERLPHVRLHNLYGPSEAATALTALDCVPDSARATVPIGRPGGNTRVYVLDRQGEPVPIGVAGELYIGGAGVSRGYLNRLELTAKKFVPDPFGTEPGARLYATGDRVRYLADGAIEFLGRIDQQVKIRGHRVEPAEIEVVLSRHPALKQVVIAARDDLGAATELVAYVAFNSPEPPPLEALRAFAGEHLPDYMIPSRWVALPALPLLANGKIDRKGLPRPADDQLRSSGEYAPPRSAPEAAVVRIWADVLGRKQVGIHDDFFALGGHSLLAMRILSRVRQELDVAVPLRALFEHPTVAELAAELDACRQRSGASPVPAIKPIARRGRQAERGRAQLEPSRR